jgi:hypothetical protein
MAPLFMDLDRSIQYVDYQKKLKSQVRTGIDSGNGEPFQVMWNRRIRNSFCGFIPKLMDFSQ